MSSSWLLFASEREVEADLAAAPNAVVLGVGKARSAATLARLLATHEPAPVLLIGVAGAYREADLAVGTLCVVTEARFADEGVDLGGGGFLDLVDLGLSPAGEASPYDPVASERVATTLGVGPRVRAATVSACSGDDALAAARFARARCEIETMESSAVALACAAAGVSLTELRCISNYCGDREHAEWDLERARATLSAAVRGLPTGARPKQRGRT